MASMEGKEREREGGGNALMSHETCTDASPYALYIDEAIIFEFIDTVALDNNKKAEFSNSCYNSRFARAILKFKHT